MAVTAPDGTWCRDMHAIAHAWFVAWLLADAQASHHSMTNANRHDSFPLTEAWQNIV